MLKERVLAIVEAGRRGCCVEHEQALVFRGMIKIAWLVSGAQG
jgi:hypothetical protein